MKRMILMAAAVVGLGVGAAILVHGTRQPGATGTTSEATESRTITQTPDDARPTAASSHRRRPQVEVQSPVSSRVESAPAADTAPAPSKAPEVGQALVKQAVETLTSPLSPYPQKQAAWKQLRDSGKFDQAINDLEKRMADDPTSPQYPATLGQAYLQKCSTLQDVREQGILAMKADQAFDAALNLDANNWEARFTKAVAMSYWPTQMNKGTEVMQHFSTLIEQQEAQSPQPQFAQAYVWLGKEYAKYGHAQEALEIWQRGAAFYPNDRELRSKLGTP